MAVLEVRVCDVCGDVGKPTATYNVGTVGYETGDLDLCEDHGGPLKRRLKRKRRGFDSYRATMDEIEERKALA